MSLASPRTSTIIVIKINLKSMFSISLARPGETNDWQGSAVYRCGVSLLPKCNAAMEITTQLGYSYRTCKASFFNSSSRRSNPVPFLLLVFLFARFALKHVCILLDWRIDFGPFIQSILHLQITSTMHCITNAASAPPITSPTYIFLPAPTCRICLPPFNATCVDAK